MLMATLRLAQARLPGLVRAIAPARTATDDEETGHAGTRRKQRPPLDSSDQAASSTFAGNARTGRGTVATVDLDAGSVRVAALHVQKQLETVTANIVNGAPRALVNLLA